MKFLTNMKQKLKVKLTVLFILTLCTTPSFADKSCFYENGKVRDTMYVNSPEGLRIRQQPSFSGVSGYFVEEDDSYKIDFTKPYIYYQAFSDCADERDSNYNPLICLSGDYFEKYTYYVPRLIEAGIDPRNSKYEKQYHDYWDPIMAEHQKKADAME